MSQKTDVPLEPQSGSPAVVVDSDLSEQISAAMQKKTGETVRCVRVFGNNYRCNWWGHAEVAPGDKRVQTFFDVTEMRVRRSTFIRATKTSEGMQIQDMTFPLSAPLQTK
jgi:hypothetical protein